jgi:hypothetical protein
MIALVTGAIIVLMAGTAFAKKVSTGLSNLMTPTDPPGTCTVKAGRGQGGGEIKEQHHEAC